VDIFEGLNLSSVSEVSDVDKRQKVIDFFANTPSFAFFAFSNGDLFNLSYFFFVDAKLVN